MPDPGDNTQFNYNYEHRSSHGGTEIREQEREGVPDPAKSGHETANETPHPRMSTPSEAAVVRKRLGKTHTDAGAKGCRQPDYKRITGVVRRERRGEYRRECGH